MYNRIHKIYLTLLHYPRMSFPLHVCSPLGPKEKPDFRVEKRVERHLTGNDKFSFWLRFWPSVCSNLWRMKSIMLNIMQYHTVPLHRKRESLYTFIVSEKNLFIAFNNFSFHSFFFFTFSVFFSIKLLLYLRQVIPAKIKMLVYLVEKIMNEPKCLEYYHKKIVLLLCNKKIDEKRMSFANFFS